MIRFLFVLFLLFFSGFSFSKFSPAFFKSLHKQKTVSLTFPPTNYPLHNKSFVIAVIGKNNGAYVEKTIDSILSQNYDAFRVIYIDDGSTDGSGSHARDVIYAHPQSQKILFLQNAQTLGAIANLLQIAESCFDDEILVVVDGENRLSHEWVLQRLNQYYANPDLWMTLSSALELPSFEPLEVTLPSSLENLRKEPKSSLYLKTFYAALFKKLKSSDLMYRGKLISEPVDFAYAIPLMEMAKEHLQILPDPLYLVTKKEDKTSPAYATYEKWIEDKSPYAPVAKLFVDSEERF